MSYIADLGHVWLPNHELQLVYTQLPLSGLTFRFYATIANAVIEDCLKTVKENRNVKRTQTPRCLFCFPTVDARVSVFRSPCCVLHTSIWERAIGKVTWFDEASVCHSQSGKIRFLLFLPWSYLVAAWGLERAAVRRQAAKCRSVPTRLSPLPVGTAETLRCPSLFFSLCRLVFKVVLMNYLQEMSTIELLWYI